MQKKNFSTSRVTEFRLKISYSRRMPIYRYTQIDSTLFFFSRKNVCGLQILLDICSIHSHPYMLQQDASQK